ncbi:prolipoprotein diacylglyceryl transferase family protein [Phenylobacterium kunshanense]|uniref:Diacylglyceryl transferase n=1 Tax=Phenylobacterium kunshanense TaxID=1445034 RepID=A0A328BB24_9CAUL|nr:prolipoprotein diacylglyceryl transferase family protein [Phenylobacterium kunshanense]RAK63661.1 diacylglyceryl transferase [Phenylobacterium kunshanense]
MIAVPTATWAHTLFDLAAWGAGLSLSALLYRWRLKALTADVAGKVGGGYFGALVAGAIPGAWMAGSLNSLQDATPALSHSVVGALVGAIVGVEIYKALRGVHGSTGGVFVGPFALGVVIGRWGCLFAGLADGTYGAPTALPFAVDLGDGIGRHPVQLYESLAMAVFLALYLEGLGRRRARAVRRGFYALCIWYGATRFGWEFLKPYPGLIGPLNLFHILCGGLVAYGWIYWRGDVARERAQGRALSVPGPDHEPVRDVP